MLHGFLYCYALVKFKFIVGYHPLNNLLLLQRLCVCALLERATKKNRNVDNVVRLVANRRCRSKSARTYHRRRRTRIFFWFRNTMSAVPLIILAIVIASVQHGCVKCTAEKFQSCYNEYDSFEDYDDGNYSTGVRYASVKSTWNCSRETVHASLPHKACVLLHELQFPSMCRVGAICTVSETCHWSNANDGCWGSGCCAEKPRALNFLGKYCCANLKCINNVWSSGVAESRPSSRSRFNDDNGGHTIRIEPLKYSDCKVPTTVDRYELSEYRKCLTRVYTSDN